MRNGERTVREANDSTGDRPGRYSDKSRATPPGVMSVNM